MRTRKKLAIATWDAPSEPNIYGKLTVDATEALEYLNFVRQKTGEKITITHLVGKAVGLALKDAPDLNGRISLGKYIPHDTVDVAFLVALEEGKDLAKAKIANIDQKSVIDIAKELREMAGKLHRGEDQEFEKSKGPLKTLPTWALRPVLKATGFLTGELGLSVKALGLEAFPFGSCIITNVGMFGLDEGFVPFTPFARVPVYVLVGAIKEAPMAVNGQLEIRKQLTLTATIDHRFIDGFQGGVLAKVVRRVLEDPWELETSDPRERSASVEA